MKTSKRRTRSRILAAAAGIAVAGGIGLGTVAAQSASASTDSSPRVAAQHTIVPLPPPSQGPASTAAEPSSKPTAARTSATASSTPAAAASPRTSSAQHVAQLTTARLPDDTAEAWKPVGSPMPRAVAGHDIGEDECVSVDGASGWIQQSFSGGDGQNVAIQDTFTFDHAAQAQNALRTIRTGMAECQGVSRALQLKNRITSNAQVSQTADSSSGAAWERSWTGVMGMSAGGPQTNHIYATVSGTELVVLQFTEFPGQATPYQVSADPGVLAMLATELTQ